MVDQKCYGARKESSREEFEDIQGSSSGYRRGNDGVLGCASLLSAGSAGLQETIRYGRIRLAWDLARRTWQPSKAATCRCWRVYHWELPYGWPNPRQLLHHQKVDAASFRKQVISACGQRRSGLKSWQSALYPHNFGFALLVYTN